ncbi:MAG: speB [Acidobacteriaceae bacterium]|nr:speB [Acidobacteriaceae bacterium]
MTSKLIVGQGAPTLLGVPFDAQSSYLRGPAGAPPLIRQAFHSEAWNTWTETGVDLGIPGAFADAGDLQVSEDNSAFEVIKRTIGKLLGQGSRPVSPGGDHSITYRSRFRGENS